MILEYPHISFKKNWEITPNISSLLGQCMTYVNTISEIAIKPQIRKNLLNLSIKKGAQSTTAIEGNTLSVEEIEKIIKHEAIQESKEYQKQEISNILEAFNEISSNLLLNNKQELISKKLILDFHRIIGKNLASTFEAVPGEFRTNNVMVGSYRAPFYDDVEELIDKLCNWLLDEFHYTKGQNLPEAIVQAIVSHVYLELIHPFADGNGRTGRLMEFNILLRSGFPDIAGHILSNHYNNTRAEYYHQLRDIKKTNSLTNFLVYALVGLRDGLIEVWNEINSHLFQISWENYIYEVFASIPVTSKSIFKRRRDLILSFPLNLDLNLDEIIQKLPIKLGREYLSKHEKTLTRDLKELEKQNLLIKTNKNTYKANSDILLQYFPMRKR